MLRKTILLSIIFSTSVFARGQQQIDLNNGVAFPSQGLAIFENPAALPASNGTVADAYLLFGNGNTSAMGSLSGQLAKSVGVGLGATEGASSVVLHPGIGFTLGQFGIGVSTQYEIGQDFSEQFEVGLNYKVKGGLAFGLVFHDALDLNDWTVGIGHMFKSFLLEGNLHFSGASAFATDNINGSLSLNILAAKNFSFLVRYFFALAPTSNFDPDGNIEISLCYWVGKSTALLASYQSPLSEYVIGLRFKL